MDDLICGSDTKEGLIDLQFAIHQAFDEFGFNLRKYASNCPALLQKIPVSLTVSESTFEFDAVAVLGLLWEPKADTYGNRLNVQRVSQGVDITKRLVWFYTSRMFDPLRLVSPILVRGKLFMKAVWEESQSWDDPISEKLAQSFESFIRDLYKLGLFEIPRFVRITAPCKLIGFRNASERAYCIVIYVRSVNNHGEYLCKLLCSKTGIAPATRLTIPKLELLIANLSATLVDRVATNLKIDMKCVHAFCDSSIEFHLTGGTMCLLIKTLLILA